MNELQIVFIATVFTGALPLLIFGLIISVKNKLHWINGVDHSKLKDPNGFCQFIGNSISITGLLILLCAIFLYLQIIGYLVFVGLLVFISFLPLPCFYIAKSKFS
ncbi:hypothetical protein [Paraglaciecola aestuariivivens]